MHRWQALPWTTQMCMNSSCMVRDSLCSLVETISLEESLLIRQLKKLSIRTPRSVGEIKGFNLKPRAVKRYYQTSEYKSSYMRQLRDMMGRNSYQHFWISHPDLQLPRIEKEETDVHAFVELMENSWINPLSHDETDLVNLSTGVLVPRCQWPSESSPNWRSIQNIQRTPRERLSCCKLSWTDEVTEPHDLAQHHEKKPAGIKAQGQQITLKPDRNPDDCHCRVQVSANQRSSSASDL